jgi:hypothetical protein
MNFNKSVISGLAEAVNDEAAQYKTNTQWETRPAQGGNQEMLHVA